MEESDLGWMKAGVNEGSPGANCRLLVDHPRMGGILPGRQEELNEAGEKEEKIKACIKNALPAR